MAQLKEVIGIDAVEWNLRCELAATFRLCARNKWNEGIGNHNSVMIPGTDTFLINPRGMLFDELRASDLIVCDLEGRVLRGRGELRKVAFHIHARMHKLNPGATVILHVHPPYSTALSMTVGGRLELAHTNNLTLNDRIVYDDETNGAVLDNTEGDRIAGLLGDKTIMFMASHGLTVVGPTIAEAYCELDNVERVCMWQWIAKSGFGPLRQMPERLRHRYNGPYGARADAALEFAALRRVLDKHEPDYAS
ncbi:MAG: aldolase [Alphaproteobacteria bacterium]|nr:aldolase [Alphaproteobacteria bacterium]